MTGIICGTGSYTPSHVMDNFELAELVDTNDAWIQERTGVAKRHIIGQETTVSMAAAAGRSAIEDAGISAEEVDLILVCTISSHMILPSAACEVQKELGAIHATGYDINAACTGFVFAYNSALAYIASGMYETVLIIGSESLSNLTNWEDRGTCILFGDGAGAAVVRASEGTLYKAVTYSDGTKGSALTCASRHVSKWKELPIEETYMQMDGQAVFKFAVKRVPEAILEALDVNEIKKADIAYYILHQANKRIVESVAKRLGEDIAKFPMNIFEYGNTSSASIPILLNEMNKEGKLKRGQRIVLAGFGAGLSWGATILEW